MRGVLSSSIKFRPLVDAVLFMPLAIKIDTNKVTFFHDCLSIRRGLSIRREKIEAMGSGISTQTAKVGESRIYQRFFLDAQSRLAGMSYAYG
jgi:hypothetical protein